MSKNVKIVKRKESYTIYNLTSNIGYYSIFKKTCSNSEIIDSGDIIINGSFNLTPKEDGEYIIKITLGTNTEEIIITHYNTLIKSIVSDIEKALCNCDCGCDGNSDCFPTEAKQCLLHQNLYSEIQLATFLIKTITNCNENYNIIKEFITQAIDLYKCDLISLFCDKQLELKIKGSYKYSDKLQKKLLAINYLSLYLYENSITDQLDEYKLYLNNKYKYNIIRECLIKTGLDIYDLEGLFSSLLYDACYEEEGLICSFNDFVNTVAPTTKEFTFNINQNLNGVYDTFTIQNTSLDTKLFINKTLYKDSVFEVQMKARTIENPVEVLPNETLEIDIIFIGKKGFTTNLNISAKYDSSTFNTYKITFN